jgi:hypothetical protein
MYGQVLHSHRSPRANEGSARRVRARYGSVGTMWVPSPAASCLLRAALPRWYDVYATDCIVLREEQIGIAPLARRARNSQVAFAIRSRLVRLSTCSIRSSRAWQRHPAGG